MGGAVHPELAEEKKLKYGIIFQCRYNDSAKLVKENLENGALGKVISARVVLTWCKPDEYYSQSDWKGTWDKEGGGVIIDQAIHSLDLANWFINDKVVSVQASLSNWGHSIMEVDDTGEGFIRYKNGATLSFWAMNNYGCDDPIEIRLLCENGKVVMDWLVCRAFVESVKKGINTPIDAYDTVSWMAIAPLSERSIQKGGMPVDIPDFTRGKWIRREPVVQSKYCLDEVITDPDTPIFP